MAILPTPLARVSNLLRTQVTTSRLSTTQEGLLKVQNELSTGKRVNTPSDDPGAAAIIEQLQKTLEQHKGFQTNLSNAKNQLSETDTVLGSLNDILQQAQSIASANVGADATPDQRAGAATIVENLYNQALTLANTQFQGAYLFGGDRATDAPFVATSGGVRYTATGNVLSNEADTATSLAISVSGADVFGGLSDRVHGRTDLAPAATLATRLDDLNGAAGAGVRRGLIELSDGTTSKTVDLSQADTLGDVVDAINAAGVGSIAASLTAGGTGLTLSAGAGDDVTVSEVGGGTTATDLGIARAAGAGAGVALVGSPVQPKVSPLTTLASLRGGAGLDASGLTIATDAQTVNVSLAGVTTVEGLLNKINGAAPGVRAQINDAGNGIDILNNTQGVAVRIGENGGSTAAQLGVRSFDAQSPLSETNDGKGVRTAAGADFAIAAASGQSFTVDVDGATTVQDVIDKINAAATTAGVNVTAAFSATTNGLTLTDATSGGGTLTVTAQNFSNAAADLGLDAPASSGVITGRDVSPTTPQGIFGNLAKLRDALRANDTAALTKAAENLDEDQKRVTRVRGATGARVQELESRADRLTDQDLATTTLLSSLQDTDFTDAITRFQTLQTALQATLQTSGKILNQSLLDFLG